MQLRSFLDRFGLVLCYVGASVLTLVIFALSLSWILLLDNPLKELSVPAGTTKAQAALLDRAENATLGLGAIYAINVPSQKEKWQSLADVAEATDIHLNRIDGVLPDDIDYDTLPPGLADDAKEHSMLRGYSLGAWKAHMNALETIIDSGVASAAIVEDDIDWDVRIKSQMRDMAKAMQTLLQPRRRTTLFGDPPTLPPRTPFEEMPAVKTPLSGSPYGDDWDVLWLGYCRMLIETHTPETNHMMYKENDTSVPDTSWLDKHGFDGHGIVLDDFPDHTRFYHHQRDGLCSLFYAVSARGARRIYHEFSQVLLYSPFDVMLMDFCNLGARPGAGSDKSLVCKGVTPQLFNHWLPDRNVTENIRWSARVNIDKLRNNDDSGFEDSWLDQHG